MSSGVSNNKLRDDDTPPANRAPVWSTTTTIVFQKKTAGSVDMQDYVTDPDGDVVTIVANQAFPQGITFNNGILSYDGAAGASDTSGLYFTASDGDYEIQSPNFRVIVANLLPVWGTVPDIVNNEGEQATRDITTFVSDPNGDSLSLSLLGPYPSGVTFDGTTLTVAAGVAVGEYTGLYFAANDGDGISYSNFFTITQQEVGDPNQPPTWAVIGTQTFTVGTASSLNIAQFASDPDNDTLTIAVTTPLPDGFSFANDTLSYNGAGIVGDYPDIAFSAFDGTVTEYSGPMTIRVQAAPSQGLQQLPPWITIDDEIVSFIVCSEVTGCYLV